LMNVLCSCGQLVCDRNNKLRWIEKLHLAIISVCVCVCVCVCVQACPCVSCCGTVVNERLSEMLHLSAQRDRE
jgi:hypothetical protein